MGLTEIFQTLAIHGVSECQKLVSIQSIVKTSKTSCVAGLLLAILMLAAPTGAGAFAGSPEILTPSGTIGTSAKNSGLSSKGAINPVPARLHILTRKEWGARAPILPMIRQRPRYITIHHSASAVKKRLSLATKMRNLQAFSQRRAKLASGKVKRAWADVPYHYYIDWKGRIAEARDPHYAGDTNTGYDPKGHILIVLEGNFEKTAPGKNQIASLIELSRVLSARWHIPVANIRTHRDYARTACPGRNLYRLMDGIRQRIARPR